MTGILAKVHRRTRRIWNYRRIERALRGKHGLEIGGPSSIFSPAAQAKYIPIPPVYDIAASVDNCNFATDTPWSRGEGGRTFQYLPGRKPGSQYIHDATALSSIADGTYDFLLASHILEHVANPLRALEEFHRVLKPKGYALVLVPNQVHTFDHRRPVTSFAHLEADLAAQIEEDDLTHLEEIVALHDLDRDKPAGSHEEFRERCQRNEEVRCMHHHVFSLDLL
ncbi:MAG TPA: methyltransferase domain-containing protein, partial [Acidobacteriaceae bacterium]|nr:methyltransferase domain-containing protein [Acidobacteriaceae bacterium]